MQYCTFFWKPFHFRQLSANVQMFQEMDRAILSDITASCSNLAYSGPVNQTPCKIMLKNRIKQLTSHRWKMTRKIETLRRTVRAHTAGNSKLQTIRDIVAFMSPMHLWHFQAQLKNSQRCRKGMRWSTTNKLFCLQLYYKSPSVYKCQLFAVLSVELLGVLTKVSADCSWDQTFAWTG